MTDNPAPPTPLARLRSRLLSRAYCNADFWAQHSAYLADQAVAALARRDTDAAEDLATTLLTPGPLHDTHILGAATDAGIDTTTWEERREKIRAYAREADQLPPRFDPATQAHRLWASLLSHYPQIAAALAEHLTQLPPSWREDLFTRENCTTCRAHMDFPGPETDCGENDMAVDTRPHRTMPRAGKTARPAPKPTTSAASTKGSSPAWTTKPTWSRHS